MFKGKEEKWWAQCNYLMKFAFSVFKISSCTRVSIGRSVVGWGEGWLEFLFFHLEYINA